MQTKKIKPETIEVQNRFFQALELILEAGMEKNFTAFCKENNLLRPRYTYMRNAYRNASESNYKIIDVDALVALVRKYNISAQWLLTGVGPMLKK